MNMDTVVTGQVCTARQVCTPSQVCAKLRQVSTTTIVFLLKKWILSVALWILGAPPPSMYRSG